MGGLYAYGGGYPYGYCGGYPYYYPYYYPFWSSGLFFGFVFAERIASGWVR